MKLLKALVITFNFIRGHLACLFFSFINRNRKKVLIYTDSRGFKVEELFNNRNPFSSYVGSMIKKYNVTFSLMPYKHTTILDFLFEYENKWANANFDYVVLHCGIVDFSPRGELSVPAIQNKKLLKVESGYHKLFKNYPRYDIKYNNEYTSSLYSIPFLKSYILPKLRSIDGLIFIEPNKIDTNWAGTYPNTRPENMNIIFDYVDIISNELKDVIKLSLWDLTNVRRYTTDNVHYNVHGFDYILDKLQGIIDEK